MSTVLGMVASHAPRSGTDAACDSLRALVAHKDALLEQLLLRTPQIVVPAPTVEVRIPHEAWWNAPLVGGALAAVFGMVTPMVATWLEQRAQRERTAAAIATELCGVQFRMLSASLSIARRLGKQNADLLTEIRSKITARLETGDNKVVLGGVESLLSLTQAERDQWQALAQGPGRGLTLKKYGLPFIEAAGDRLNLLSGGTLNLLARLRAAMDIFNQQVEETMRYYWMTFEDLSGANYDVVNAAIPRHQNHVLRAALHVASCVVAVLEQDDFAKFVPSQLMVEPAPEAPPQNRRENPGSPVAGR